MEMGQFLKGNPFHTLAAQIISTLFPLHSFKNVPDKFSKTIPNKMETFFFFEGNKQNRVHFSIQT